MLQAKLAGGHTRNGAGCQAAAKRRHAEQRCTSKIDAAVKKMVLEPDDVAGPIAEDICLKGGSVAQWV